MPNGKPGDHPYTDIVIHGSSSEFGENVSDLVRAMSKKPGFATVRDQVAQILQDCSPYWSEGLREEKREEAERRLRAIDATLDVK